MPSEADFLDAVDANSDDDALRLAHADWLQANGDPDRAEFIRLQIQSARSGHLPYDVELAGRIAVLLRQHEGRWLAGRPQHGNLRWQFERGYPEFVRFFSVAAWRATWRDVFAHPVRDVAFHQIKGAARLAAEPGLGRLRGLKWACLASDADLLPILESPHLDRLERLDIDLTEGSLVARIAGLPSLARLRSLAVRCVGTRLDEATLRALVESPHLAGLHELSLHAPSIEGHAAVLWRTRGLPALRCLRLPWAHLTPADWQALDGSAGLPLLESLFLETTTVGALGAQAIARAPWRLRHLDLVNGQITDQGAAALAGAAHLSRLERLTLRFGSLTDAGAAALASSPHLRSLSSLILSSNLIGEAGVLALGRSLSLPALRHLDLEENPAPTALRTAVEARFRDGLPPVEWGVPEPTLPPAPPASAPAVGDADEDGLIRAILADPWDGLARGAYADWLEERGAVAYAAVIRAPREWPNLVGPILAGLREDAPGAFVARFTRRGLLRVDVPVRSLRSRAFGRDGPAWLRRHHVAEVMPEGTPADWAGVLHAPIMAHVRCLWIDSALESTGLEALASSPHLASLASLELASIGRLASNNLHQFFLRAAGLTLCRFSLQGPGLFPIRLRQLAESSFAPGLQSLSIGYLHDGMESTEIIARSPAFAGLVTLELEGRYLNDPAVVALADAPRLPALRNLSLETGMMTEAGCRALAGSPLLRQLRRLRVVPYLADRPLADLARAVADSPHCRLVVNTDDESLAAILGDRLIVE